MNRRKFLAGLAALPVAAPVAAAATPTVAGSLGLHPHQLDAIRQVEKMDRHIRHGIMYGSGSGCRTGRWSWGKPQFGYLARQRLAQSLAAPNKLLEHMQQEDRCHRVGQSPPRVVEADFADAERRILAHLGDEVDGYTRQCLNAIEQIEDAFEGIDDALE
jgi:hypothetical protein